MVAVGGIVAATNLGRKALQVVDALQQVNIACCLSTVGVDHHQAVVATAEEVDIHQQLHLGELYQRILDKIARAHKSAFLAAEEQEDIGVASSLKVGHTGQVHHRRRTAGVVVGTVEDGIAVHAEVFIVGGKDDHGVGLTGNVSTYIL